MVVMVMRMKMMMVIMMKVMVRMMVVTVMMVTVMVVVVTVMVAQESSTPQFKSINSSALSLLHSPTLTSIHDHRKNHSLD